MELENIKFKAKSTLDGAWIQGDLIHKEDGKIAILRNGFYLSEVDPSTVCQFTGQFDIYRNSIYEHDLIECEEADAVYEVVWDEGDASFNLINTQNAGLLPATLGNWLRLQSFKVIGNKFN